MLEPAVAVGEPERGGVETGLRPVGGQDLGALEDRRDVRLVGAGVRPDRAADGARDGQPELEARQPGALGHGRRPGHRDARLGDEPLVEDLGPFGPDLDDEPADARVGDDHVAPPPEDHVRDRRGSGRA